MQRSIRSLAIDLLRNYRFDSQGSNRRLILLRTPQRDSEKATDGCDSD
jgi:hypothetical protein